MHLRWGPRRRSPRLLARGGGLDLISDLPDDLLLLVLAGLPCVSAAARTEVLSRRWRSLWARLGQIVFSDVPFHSLEAVLRRLPRPIPVLSLLEIRFPNERLPWPIPEEHLVDAASVNSLLRAAARLEPEEFEFELPANLLDGPLIVDLPCFHRATSILLDLHPVGVILRVPAGVEFPALEELHLWACTVDIDALLSCSPRLRTLCLSNVYSDSDDDLVVSATVAVSSTSLQELVLCQTDWMDGVNIVAPVLKQLTVSFSMEPTSIFVLAPMAEMVSWRCCYLEVPIVFGVWRLEQVTLQTAATPGQLPSLHIHASANSIFVCEEETFMHEMEKHMIAEFSVLELHLETNGHVFGALAFHVLRMNRLCSARRKLKVILQRSSVKEGCSCSPHCPCESTGWRSQTISLTGIEEVEINGCGGDDHEIDFMKLILECAPMLKKIIAVRWGLIK
ncbi:hypothetical protein VPH35_039678 [Triticum aestivum]|uniref:F-box domain-containing protein n=1 Tax=Triticum aestivum TaxID=4565 RepID=A0A3B6DJK3_WHEAT